MPQIPDWPAEQAFTQKRVPPPYIELPGICMQESSRAVKENFEVLTLKWSKEMNELDVMIFCIGSLDGDGKEVKDLKLDSRDFKAKPGRIIWFSPRRRRIVEVGEQQQVLAALKDPTEGEAFGIRSKKAQEWADQLCMKTDDFCRFCKLFNSDEDEGLISLDLRRFPVEFMTVEHCTKGVYWLPDFHCADDQAVFILGRACDLKQAKEQNTDTFQEIQKQAGNQGHVYALNLQFISREMGMAMLMCGLFHPERRKFEYPAIPLSCFGRSSYMLRISEQETSGSDSATFQNHCIRFRDINACRNSGKVLSWSGPHKLGDEPGGLTVYELEFRSLPRNNAVAQGANTSSCSFQDEQPSSQTDVSALWKELCDVKLELRKLTERVRSMEVKHQQEVAQLRDELRRKGARGEKGRISGATSRHAEASGPTQNNQSK